MKPLSTALAVTAVLALAACGGRPANNSAAAIDTSNDVYNVSPDDLTLNDLGNSGNGSSGANMSTGSNASSGGNASSSAHDSTSNASRNSH
jgi:hypothetical protein